ncbi:ribosomal l39 protein domain-containing protein [Purpureocillium lilacinum]|uniref:Large ribosomal subunit protein eL39 n=1 Tax=Purpureocillium lilacinum TaxID=33203 RepID=A0A179H4X2_PURLI|nr:ribosomal l39 protein domain-containing protein [Purpureocillium lilacinum]
MLAKDSVLDKYPDYLSSDAFSSRLHSVHGTPPAVKRWVRNNLRLSGPVRLMCRSRVKSYGFSGAVQRDATRPHRATPAWQPQASAPPRRATVPASPCAHQPHISAAHVFCAFPALATRVLRPLVRVKNPRRLNSTKIVTFKRLDSTRPKPSRCRYARSHKSFRTKQKLAKAQKQNRPVPQWIRLRTGNTVRYIQRQETALAQDSPEHLNCSPPIILDFLPCIRHNHLQASNKQTKEETIKGHRHPTGTRPVFFWDQWRRLEAGRMAGLRVEAVFWREGTICGRTENGQA